MKDTNVWYKGAGGITAQMLIGHSLTSVNGTQWKRQRNCISKLFQPSNIHQYKALLLECVRNSISELDEKLISSQYLDLSVIFRSLSLNVNIKSCLGSIEEEERLMKVFMRVWQWWRSSDKGQESFQPPISELKYVLCETIRRRRKSITKGSEEFVPSFLSSLILQQGNNDEYLEFDELVDNLISFLLAGFETLAHTITMCVYLSTVDKSFNHELSEEMNDLDEDDVNSSHLLEESKNLDFLIKETLRLYQPVPGATRYPQKGIYTPYPCPQYRRVITDTLVSHRDHLVWGHDAHLFNPYRWKNVTTEMKDYYMPWGSGKRYCVGMKFGIFAAKLILFEFLRTYEVHVQPGYEPLFHLTPTLTLQNGFPVEITKRCNK
eukprot:TRINITY_DN12496_c0_g1_i1.p1 TRINITY_DN12496_c0_g1~~TRINITY_DN12496_c0_g1_i1.p1  ORF type:complete len:378 (-),score=51.93 TRINITY_DN12496_c0_g1_i1:99-1232(-)